MTPSTEPTTATHTTSLTFPQPFLAFLSDNGLSVDEYSFDGRLPRYIRVKPTSADTFSIPDLEADLGTPVTPVEWLEGFYRLDGDVRIATCRAYKEGRIYGIDISSGVAVHALDVQPNDNVLDVCCAPGMKLCNIADLQGRDGLGTVTGVDISKDRLATCKNLLKKYKLERARLFAADGTSFSVYAPSTVGQHTHPAVAGTPSSSCSSIPSTAPADTSMGDSARAEKPDEDMGEGPPSTVLAAPIPTEKIKPFHATRMLRQDPQLSLPDLLYDKVLVDAECTHDGSIVHLLKYDRLGWKTFEEKFMDPDRLTNLQTLQRGLIANGYKLLKPGGVLVYSTCSFSRMQNEDIVAWFLGQHPDAVLEPVPGVERFPVASTLAHLYLRVDLSHVIRFSPVPSQTSGLFIARIRKALLT
ncbi:S-adenosyl-L-methionine-dependent methyltransferase [Fimicolochytrium jonesii]|uniref:S-adenosyl-L-methionine-dependent methyltransferase n=1 Tax=Fimicolochytrium jonesii TaxID=1396493 RepID=UPI0022FE10AD|nr:S-adenosyl-L-methionine-dependent methyltransferase [Fimicolochytrium jonesii]KAI8819845.1 S-adenosyl-L-methionine-dependent methyltransferase [Fimicolochytrium jonesii]